MMQLIVLGIIPGTSIQMTFELLANSAGTLLTLYLCVKLYSRYTEGLPSYKSPRLARVEADTEVAHKRLTRLLLGNA